MVSAALAFASWAPACTTFSDVVYVEGEDAGEPLPDGGSGEVSFLSVEDAARACSRAMSCPQLPASIVASSGVPLDPVNFSMCLTWLAGPISPARVGLATQRQTLQCVADATGCIQAGECLSLEYLNQGDPRCANHGTGGSSGSAGGGGAGGGAGGGGTVGEAVYCSDSGLDVIHCDTFYAIHCNTPFFTPGTQCLEGADGSLWCSSGQNCVGSDSCAGTVLEYCGGTTELRFSVNCAAVGTTCGLDTDLGYVDCLTNGVRRNCVGTAATCSGDSVEVCDNAEISIFDCASIGRTCAADQGLARCASQTDTCTPFDVGMNECEGDTLKVCVGGKPVDLDCSSVGLSCLPASGAQAGRCG